MIHRRAGEEQLSSPAGTDMWWKVSIGMPHLIYLWGGGLYERLMNYDIDWLIQLNGINFTICRVDSIAWNPHKMLGAPLQCAAFLIKRTVMNQFRLKDQWLILAIRGNIFIFSRLGDGRFLKLQDILHRCNGASASYLFQQDKFYDVSYDTGDKSVQCGRKVDAFKLWLLWKARGDQGLEKIVDNSFDCAE